MDDDDSMKTIICGVVLFRGIEGVKEKLGVRSYALQMTTLEEVFLKIADDEENEREELLIN
jgi:hypothetical protein